MLFEGYRNRTRAYDGLKGEKSEIRDSACLNLKIIPKKEQKKLEVRNKKKLKKRKTSRFK